MSDYNQFLTKKLIKPTLSGFDVDEKSLNPLLFPFQNAVVRWALRLGKAAIFENVGLGKTFQQLEWARLVSEHTQKPVLILTWWGVAHQTIKEGIKFGIPVIYANDANDISGIGIYVTNYERLEKFEDIISEFSGVVLDESSILKNYDGKTKRYIIELFSNTPYKLACSATPAPNDYVEFGSHSEFLNVMPHAEMLTRWFVHDSARTQEWRLKGHAQKDFWRWVTSWAVCIAKPKDLGDEYHMDGYDLPPLVVHHEWVGISEASLKRAFSQGQLIPAANASSTEIHAVKRDSLDLRLSRTIELVKEIGNDPIIIWCETNAESEALAKAIPQALEVKGSDSPKSKEDKIIAFGDGSAQILITKPSIAGMGLNWQHCNRAIFFSPTFSFEGEYQAIGRNHRYGQKREVHMHLIVSDAESNISDIVDRKRKAFDKMQKAMNDAMHQYGLFRDDKRLELTMPELQIERGKNWTLYLGDCVQQIKQIPDESIDFSVYSPPFAAMYQYSDAEADMGNCANDGEFMEHYKFLIAEKYRVTKSGRLSAVHCADLPSFKGKDGFVGLKDFSGEIIRAHQELGWIYHTRITIWKNPVVEMQRTKAVGLLHKQFVKDSTMTRVGTPDYILVFRKEGQNQTPVTKNLGHGDSIGDIQSSGYEQTNPSIDIWQHLASPVWMDINQTNTLNFEAGKGANDEKHICPLQLGVSERLIDWYTNEGETVLSPFAGIGSEIYSALKLRRKGIGIELKTSYFKVAVKNCIEAERAASQKTLFDVLDEQACD